MVWTFTLFWYQIYDDWEGTYLYDYTYILLVNLVFTSLPVIFMGAFDQDVTAEIAMTVPQLYNRGILRKEWTATKFWYKPSPAQLIPGHTCSTDYTNQQCASSFHIYSSGKVGSSHCPAWISTVRVKLVSSSLVEQSLLSISTFS